MDHQTITPKENRKQKLLKSKLPTQARNFQKLHTKCKNKKIQTNKPFSTLHIDSTL